MIQKSEKEYLHQYLLLHSNVISCQNNMSILIINHELDKKGSENRERRENIVIIDQEMVILSYMTAEMRKKRETVHKANKWTEQVIFIGD